MLTIFVKRWRAEYELSSYLTKEVTTLVYNTVVLPLVDYFDIPWSSIIQHDKVRLQSLQHTQLCKDNYVLHALLVSNDSFAMVMSLQQPLLSYFTLMDHYTTIVVIAGQPAGEVSFVYSPMQTGLMGHYSGKKLIDLAYVSKPLLNVIIAILLAQSYYTKRSSRLTDYHRKIQILGKRRIF